MNADSDLCEASRRGRWSARSSTPTTWTMLRIGRPAHWLALIESRRHVWSLDELTDNRPRRSAERRHAWLGLARSWSIEFVHGWQAWNVPHFHQHVFVRHRGAPGEVEWSQPWPECPRAATSRQGPGWPLSPPAVPSLENRKLRRDAGSARGAPADRRSAAALLTWVDPAGRQRGVAEDFLHAPQVGATFEQVGGHGMTQTVRAEIVRRRPGTGPGARSRTTRGSTRRPRSPTNNADLDSAVASADLGPASQASTARQAAPPNVRCLFPLPSTRTTRRSRSRSSTSSPHSSRPGSRPYNSSSTAMSRTPTGPRPGPPGRLPQRYRRGVGLLEGRRQAAHGPRGRRLAAGFCATVLFRPARQEHPPRFAAGSVARARPWTCWLAASYASARRSIYVEPVD